MSDQPEDYFKTDIRRHRVEAASRIDEFRAHLLSCFPDEVLRSPEVSIAITALSSITHIKRLDGNPISPGVDQEGFRPQV